MSKDVQVGAGRVIQNGQAEAFVALTSKRAAFRRKRLDSVLLKPPDPVI